MSLGFGSARIGAPMMSAGCGPDCAIRMGMASLPANTTGAAMFEPIDTHGRCFTEKNRVIWCCTPATIHLASTQIISSLALIEKICLIGLARVAL